MKATQVRVGDVLVTRKVDSLTGPDGPTFVEQCRRVVAVEWSGNGHRRSVRIIVEGPGRPSITRSPSTDVEIERSHPYE